MILTASQPNTVLYVINRNPASIAIVNPDTWKPAESIPIDPNPTHALLHPTKPYLYVLHNGLSANSTKDAGKVSFLSIVDLSRRKILERIDVGWNASGIRISGDGRFISIWSPGRTDSKYPVNAAENRVLPRNAGSGGNRAYLTVVELNDDHPTFTLELGPVGSRAYLSNDSSRIVSVAYPELEKKRKEQQWLLKAALLPATHLEMSENFLRAVRTAPRKKNTEVWTAEVGSQFPPERGITVELDCWPEHVIPSPDGKWLYIIDYGIPSSNLKRYRDGTLSIVELQSAKLAADHKLGPLPGSAFLDRSNGELAIPAWASLATRKAKIYRFRGSEALDTLESEFRDPHFIFQPEGLQDRILAVSDRVCRWPATASALSTCISLRPGEKEGRDAARSFDDVPGWMMFLPKQERLVMANWGLADRIAIIDLRRNLLESALVTGRAGVKFGKGFGVALVSGALSGGLSAATLGFASLAAGIALPITLPQQPSEFITARSDGDFIYAYNGMSNDVTIIQTETGRVIDKIAVGGGCRGIGFHGGDKLLWAASAGQVTVIDAETNTRKHEYQLSGNLNGLFFLRSAPRTVALLSRSVQIFDSVSGSLIDEVKGYSDPILVLERVPQGKP